MASPQLGGALDKQAEAEGAVEPVEVEEVGGEQARPILDLIRTSVCLTTSMSLAAEGEDAAEDEGGAVVVVVEEAQTDLCRPYKRRKTRGKISPIKRGQINRRVLTQHTLIHCRGSTNGSIKRTFHH